MGFRDIFRQNVFTKYTPSIYKSEIVNSDVEEQFKGIVPKVEVKFPKELGEEHPFDYTITEGLYKEFGPVTGIIDKFIDFIVGPGFFIEAEDERAKQIIEDFMRDTNFDTLLRAWVKEALVKGSGYLELGGKENESPQGMKILDAKWMYIQRDDLGVVEKYNQFIGRFGDKFDKEKITPFETFEIAHLSLGKIGSAIYGLGVVYPGITSINALIGNRKEVQTLLRRKANAPIHAKIGNKEKNIMPTPEDVDAFGKKLEFMMNKHEWATDALVELNVLDFGNVSEQFQWILNHDLDMIFFTFQVPEVLMGRGSIPEGLARVQMDAFERRIQSIQAEVEKVIENNIFNRVLQANGLDVHVEFQWGQPSNTEKKERLEVLTNLLKLDNITPMFAGMLEMESAKLLGFDERQLEEAEEQREREEEREQPIVPGQNTQSFDSNIKEQVYQGKLVI